MTEPPDSPEPQMPRLLLLRRPAETDAPNWPAVFGDADTMRFRDSRYASRPEPCPLPAIRSALPRPDWSTPA